MLAIYIGTSIGMVAGNYFYQSLCFQPDWGLATERAFFQAVALIVVGTAIGIRSLYA